VGGRAPTILPHAEYAVVESSPAGATVTLRRVALEGAALRAPLQHSTMPLAPSLLAQYANV
jgi:hypothetical protein